MLDSLVQGAGTAQQFAWATFGSLVGIPIVGKIVWSWMSTPKQCTQHDGMCSKIEGMTKDIIEIKTDIKWMISNYKRSEGE